MLATHRYLGDRFTPPELRGRLCMLPRRPNGRCYRGRNGNIEVQWSDGTRDVVVGRRLRKIKEASTDE